MSCRYSGTNRLGSHLFPGTWDQPLRLPARGRRVPPLALKDWFLPLCISFSCPPAFQFSESPSQPAWETYRLTSRTPSGTTDTHQASFHSFQAHEADGKAGSGKSQQLTQATD